MPPTRTIRGALPPGLPRTAGWMKKLLFGLLGAYVVELLLEAAGTPVVAWLAWWPPHDRASAPWQALTHWLVVPGGPGSVSGVLFGLLAVWFLLPPVVDALGRRGAIEAFCAAAVGGTLAVVVIDALASAGVIAPQPGPVLGWTVLTVALVSLFGLARPDANLMLYFVLPIPAWVFVWGSLGVSLLMLLASVGSSVRAPVEHVGVWIGAWVWYRTRGPGGRRRALIRKAKHIERELARFSVLPGGKQDVHRAAS